MNWVWIIVLGMVYGVVHSLLASHWLKAHLGPLLGRWYRLFFNVVAGVTLLPVLALPALLPNQRWYSVPTPWAWFLVLLQVTAAAAAGITLLRTGVWRFLGLAQLFQRPKLPPNTLYFKGAYRWVRHPLYFFSLIFLWATPVMTRNQAALYAVFSVYFLIGAKFEERKLAAEYGQLYQDYQKRVPMLLPWKVWLWFGRG
jgi:protein-S-isoprenylcysteine O-methyltransferase Ste14